MKIYFDGILIDPKYYMSISNDYSVFADTFYLGSTASNSFTIKIDKRAVNSQPTEVVIKDDNDIILATLDVDKIEDDSVGYVYTLTDKMLNFEFNYNAKPLIDNSSTGKVSLLEILQDICAKAGVICGLSSLVNECDVSWYDNTITAREYIEYIAELQASYAYIDNDGVLQFSKHKKNSVKTINFNLLGDYTIGEQHVISRVVYELGTLKYEYGDETHDTLYININNPFVVSDSQIEYVYNNIKDFEFYSFTSTQSPIYFNEVKAGDIIIFTDGTNNYPTIAQYTISYFGGWTGGYSLDVKSTKQAETEYKGLEEQYKRLKITVDRDLNEIKEEVGEVEEKTQAIKMFNSVLAIDNQIIPTNADKYPLETTTYTITTASSYLGTIVTPSISISGSATGITASVSGTSILLSVNTNTPITNLTNTYTINFSYTAGGTTYTDRQTLVVTLAKQGLNGEDAAIQSATAPTDTDYLWYDTVNNQLKRYNGTEWVTAYGSDLTTIKTDLATAQNTASNAQTTANNNYNDLINKLNDYATNSSVTTQISTVTNRINSTSEQISVINETLQNGVAKVKTENNFTFDINGLDISSSETNIHNTLNTYGMEVKQNSETLLFAGYDTDSKETIVKTKNIKVEKYASFPHVRVESYNNPSHGTGTGYFYIA